ncbi:MAG: hypothetical protein AABM42_07330 [Actinomycetota bacterium]
MGLVVDLPFSYAPWESAGQVDVAAIVADLEAKAARDNATADQLQAELSELRRQPPPGRTPAMTQWIKTGEPRTPGAMSVIDLSEPIGEEEGPPVVIELARGSSELAEAREIAERWERWESEHR